VIVNHAVKYTTIRGISFPPCSARIGEPERRAMKAVTKRFIREQQESSKITLSLPAIVNSEARESAPLLQLGLIRALDKVA